MSWIKLRPSRWELNVYKVDITHSYVKEYGISILLEAAKDDREIVSE